jgi:hypothetical protein
MENDGRLFISILLTAFGVFFAFCNWGCVVVSEINKRKGIDKHSSMIPLFSTVAFYLAFCVYPFHLAWWIVLVALVDPSLLSLIYLPFFLIRRQFSTRANNRSG